jgi:hypothetical protein
MATFWDRIRALDGQTLNTENTLKNFRIVDVTIDRVTFAPLTGKGTSRSWRRRDLEALNERLEDAEQITPAMVKEQYPKDQNTSYIAVILNSVREA